MQRNPNPIKNISLRNHTPSLNILEAWLRIATRITNTKCMKASAKNHLKVSYSLTHTDVLVELLSHPNSYISAGEPPLYLATNPVVSRRSRIDII